MSFAAPKRVIEQGDTVILYLGINNMHSIEVQSEVINKHGQMVPYTHQTTYGALKVDNLVGKEYGAKIELTRGYGYILQPNPELWTLNLPHRTQILYTPDISMILLQLEVKPGSRIVEAGKMKILILVDVCFHSNLLFKERDLVHSRITSCEQLRRAVISTHSTSTKAACNKQEKSLKITA